jgi:hypothetical protein
LPVIHEKDPPVYRIRGKTLDEKNYVLLKAYALASIEPSRTHTFNLTISYFTHIRYSRNHNIYENVCVCVYIYIYITVFL